MIFSEIWFWMLIASIIAIGLGIYVYEISRGSREGVPFLAYLLLILGIILLIISLAAASLRYHNLILESYFIDI